MFGHNFWYSFRVLFRNKMLIFWTFAFPIIMAFFFSMAFSSITKDEMLQPFDVAVVDCGSNQNQFLKEAIKKVAEEESMIHVLDISLEEANILLEEKEIVGYLIVDEKKVVVKQNGINETVFQQIVEQIVQKEILINDLVQQKVMEQMQLGNQVDYNVIYQESVTSVFTEFPIFISDTSSNHMDYVMIEYYTLIAMACLYGSTLGMFAILNVLANMSKKGMRISIAPTSKMTMVLSSALAAFVTQLIGLSLLFFVTILFLHVDYGNYLFGILLLAFCGCLAGLSMGIAVATIVKKNENTKLGILLALTMFGCFLSGMMGITMKYLVDSHVPFLNWMNPANMITDGFYALYYYESFGRYWFNVGSLFVFSLLLLIIAVLFLRRQTYDSL